MHTKIKYINKNVNSSSLCMLVLWVCISLYSFLNFMVKRCHYCNYKLLNIHVSTKTYYLLATNPIFYIYLRNNKATTHLTVLEGLLLGQPVLEIGAGYVRSLMTIGRFASKEPFTERDSCGDGC